MLRGSERPRSAGREARTKRRVERQRRLWGLRSPPFSLQNRKPSSGQKKEKAADDSQTSPIGARDEASELSNNAIGTNIHPASYSMNDRTTGAGALLKCCTSALRNGSITLSRIESLLNVAQSLTLMTIGSNTVSAGAHENQGDRLNLTAKMRAGKDVIQLIRNLRNFDRMIDEHRSHQHVSVHTDQLLCMKDSVARKKERARVLWRKLMADTMS